MRMPRRRGRRRPKEDRKEQSKEEREGEEQEGLQGCRQGRNNQFSKPQFQWYKKKKQSFDIIGEPPKCETCMLLKVQGGNHKNQKIELF